MPVRLPPNVYGDRTDDLQRIISDAEGLSVFTPRGHRSEERSVITLVQAHIAALRAELVDVPPTSGVRLIRGGADTLDTWWPTGATWREAVGEVIGRLHDRHGPSAANRLGPPLWPTGLINVFGVVVVATEEGWERCLRVGGDTKRRDTCWECLCFAEKIVDASLVAAFFNDRAGEIFAPLLSMMRSGWIPVGHKDGSFTCAEFGGPPSLETLRFSADAPRDGQDGP